MKYKIKVATESDSYSLEAEFTVHQPEQIGKEVSRVLGELQKEKK